MYTSEQVMRGLAQLTPPWYYIAMTDENGTSRYCNCSYEDKELAQQVALALQDAYQQAGYDVMFCVRLRDMENV